MVATKRAVQGFKEWFPAAHHSSPPLKAASFPRRFIGCVYTVQGPGWDLFREELPRRVGGPRRTIVLPRKITHLSGRVKTKDRVTDPARLAKNARFQRAPSSRTLRKSRLGYPSPFNDPPGQRATPGRALNFTAEKKKESLTWFRASIALEFLPNMLHILHYYPKKLDI